MTDDKIAALLGLPSVKQQLSSVLPVIAADCGDFVISLTERFFHRHPRCDSPIEVIFAGWWIGLDLVLSGGTSSRLQIIPQVEIDTDSGSSYRADFVVSVDNSDGYFTREQVASYPKICIELDGHDYHEKTKEQATSRNKRDREMQQSGWKTFHISGSELYRNGYQAVSDVYMFAHDEIVELHAAKYHESRRAIRL